MTDDHSARVLAQLRTAVTEGRAPAPHVRHELAVTRDPGLARRAGRLLATLPQGTGDLRPVRVTVTATGTVGPVEAMLHATLVAGGMLPQVEVTAYGSFELALATGGFGEGGDPDLVLCLVDDAYFLPRDWDGGDVAALTEHAADRLARLRELVATAAGRTAATLVLHTVPLPAEVRDAVLSVRSRAELTRAWYDLNSGLLGLAAEHPQVAVADLVGLLADSPVAARDDRLHRFADLPYTEGASLLLAQEVRRVAQARLGLSRKVLALDLDNTLWGGEVGEVGAEAVVLGGLYPGAAYLDLQRAAARLRRQGVVLVLASKNDPAVVDAALTAHPEVLLRPESFSVRAVNWTSKADNLAAAAESLGLSTGTFVFVDDSAFERGQVATDLPDVALVDAGGDPAHTVRRLLSAGWFDVPELTGVDRARPELYRSRAMRSDFSSSFGSSEDYLRALEIELTAEPVTGFEVARAAQLAARTNQFNLTGLRPDAAATAAMAADPGQLVAGFSVRDRFGDEGLIGAAWLRRGDHRWDVLNLVLSCRVLGRGIELAIANWLAEQARRAGAAELSGRYVATAKNGAARHFWTRAGFTPADDRGEGFVLDLTAGDVAGPAWITVREQSEV